MGENKFVAFKYDDDIEVSKSVDPAELEGRERRRHHRYKVGVLTEIITDDKKRIPGITFNISESGAFLMTLAPLTLDEVVDLVFVSTEEEKEVVRARVVHGATLNMDVCWSQGIGVEFIENVPSFFHLEFPEDESKKLQDE